MGWQQNIFPLLIVNASGGFSGLFVYSPAPGPGNLVAAIAGAAGTDPYGNAYSEVFSAGAIGTSFLQVDEFGDLLLYSAGNLNIVANPTKKALFIYNPAAGAGNLVASVAAAPGTDAYGNAYPAGLSSQAGGIEAILAGKQLGWDAPADHPFALPSIFANPSAANGNSLQISTGEGIVASNPAALTLYDSAASASVAAIPSGSPGIFLAGGCYLYSDTRHNLTLDAGWTAGSGTNSPPQYWFEPDGGIKISGFATHAAFSGTLALNSSNPLAAAYRPAHNQRFGAYTSTGACGMALTTAGVLQVEVAPASSADIRFCSPSLPLAQ